jgi:hypothetical protein
LHRREMRSLAGSVRPKRDRSRLLGPRLSFTFTQQIRYPLHTGKFPVSNDDGCLFLPWWRKGDAGSTSPADSRARERATHCAAPPRPRARRDVPSVGFVAMMARRGRIVSAGPGDGCPARCRRSAPAGCLFLARHYLFRFSTRSRLLCPRAAPLGGWVLVCRPTRCRRRRRSPRLAAPPPSLA